MILDSITIYDFKKCYNGDLSPIDGDNDKWKEIFEAYNKRIKTKGANITLELQKQIAIKENTIVLLNNYLFIIQQAFKSYLFSQDKTYIDLIISSSAKMKKFGIKFNPDNELEKELNKCGKLINNKSNEIKILIKKLKTVNEEGITFDKLIAIVGKYSGSGILNQKIVTVSEFCEFYNLMIEDNGK